MYPQREDGPHYQSAWDAFTGLFDKDRKKKPIRPPTQPDEDEPDRNVYDDELKDQPSWQW